ncbi:GNAT family N-acetyltransferase [Oxyplasma meridianum]|uniref:GNAT family N-acetyltransferase n=1 Tax=Oxyplasma meridianum TaxID=3073602 RepID=A0AAX4NH80_9ARCH
MELTNVKVDWNPILENYISHLETIYPDIPIRGSYSYIINNLNENRIPSRIVLQGNNVAAYAYLLENPDFKDRLYAYIGFISEEFSKKERIENLVTWIENLARNRKRIVVINDVFNGGKESENFLIGRKYDRIERYGMTLKLRDATNLDEKFPIEFMAVDLSEFNIEEFLKEEYEAYRDTPDFILFHELDKDKGSNFTRKIFSGMYGEILNRPSILIRHKDQLAGSCIITDGFPLSRKKVPLVVDIFVKREYRRNGLATEMLSRSINILRDMKYEELSLWATVGNPAMSVYEDLGFVKNQNQKEISYVKKIF